MGCIRKWIKQTNSPWIGFSIINENDIKWIPNKIYDLDDSSIVRVLRGRKMQTRQSLMDEFSAALQFFDGFGENWRVLNECLCYKDEWLLGSLYLLIINDAHQILSQESDDEMKWLLVTLDEVGEWWSKPITDNGRFNRPAIAFHTLLKCPSDEMEGLKERKNGKLPSTRTGGANCREFGVTAGMKITIGTREGNFRFLVNCSRNHLAIVSLKNTRNLVFDFKKGEIISKQILNQTPSKSKTKDS